MREGGAGDDGDDGRGGGEGRGGRPDGTGTGTGNGNGNGNGDGDGGAGAGRTASGPGRLLIAVYAIFAVAATSRAVVQISTKFHEAPVAYLLSALAGVVYVAATVGLTRRTARGRWIAAGSCTAELLGVLTVGLLSLVDPAAFPDQAVWSNFGQGYGFLPLVLPVLGLLWLRHTAHPPTGRQEVEPAAG